MEVPAGHSNVSRGGQKALPVWPNHAASYKQFVRKCRQQFRSSSCGSENPRYNTGMSEQVFKGLQQVVRRSLNFLPVARRQERGRRVQRQAPVHLCPCNTTSHTLAPLLLTPKWLSSRQLVSFFFACSKQLCILFTHRASLAGAVLGCLELLRAGKKKRPL